MTMSERKLQCCVLEVRTPDRTSRESGYEHERAHTWLLVQLGALGELTEELTPLRTAVIAVLIRALLCCLQALPRIASKVGEFCHTPGEWWGHKPRRTDGPRALRRGLVPSPKLCPNGY